MFEQYSELIPLTFYSVYYYYADNTNPDNIYNGTNKEEAYNKFNKYEADYSDVFDYYEPYITISEQTDMYRFVYELEEDENVNDYPITEYYDDSYYYELEDNGEISDIDVRYFPSIDSMKNDFLKKIEDFRFEFISEFEAEYHDYIQYKNKGGYTKNTMYYYMIFNNSALLKKNEDLFKFSDESKEYDHITNQGDIIKKTKTTREIKNTDKENILLCIRIGDHSQRLNNIDEEVDCSLSLVITNENDTGGKFISEDKFHEEIIYDKDILFNDDDFYTDLYVKLIMKDIDEKIDEFISEYDEIKNNRE